MVRTKISLNSIKQITAELNVLQFSVYAPMHEQKPLIEPISTPMLNMVISGEKMLGKTNEINCHSDQFKFFSPDSTSVDMPESSSYFSILIEFNYEDFEGIPSNEINKPDYLIVNTMIALKHCLQQFVESAVWAPEEIIAIRKREILTLLYHLGYTKVLLTKGPQKISQRLYNLFHEKKFHNVTMHAICKQLAMSESTLRRKLVAEGTSVKDIKSRARLGLSLHLLQTTSEAIGLIGQKCGYHSQSRFTQMFKAHFGLTPSELRKTRVTVSGE